jgi:hypothetical protein
VAEIQQQPAAKQQHVALLQSLAATAAAFRDAQQQTTSLGGGSGSARAQQQQQQQQLQCVCDQEVLQQQELQLQERNQDTQLRVSCHMTHDSAAAAASGLGPAGLALVKQELGALPSQQQLQYWQLADRPFETAELQQLVTHYLLPGQAEVLAGRANRSGRARPVLIQVPDIVQRQYPGLAPSLHGLMAQLQQERPDGISSSSSGRPGKRKAADPAGRFLKSPAAVVLLHALRCLQLWETRQVTQPDMPTLLQRLAEQRGGAAATAAAAATGSIGDAWMDVLEIVDLTGDAYDQGQPVEASCESVQLQAFLAGQVDVLLVREQQGRQGSSGAGLAHGVRVKDELEG